MSKDIFIKMVRNLKTCEKNGKTNIYLEYGVLEAAGFKPGEGVEMEVTQDSVIFTRSESTLNIIHKRKRASWPHPRPVLDRCSEEITQVIRARARIDILVYEGRLIIREERSFDICLIEPPSLQGRDLKKLRLFSAPSGAGFATSALIDSGYYESCGGIDVWGEAMDAYRLNFNNGVSIWSDVRYVHPDYLPQADAIWLSPPCVCFSALKGFGASGGFLEGIGMMFARLVMATGAKMIFIEQVPQYYKSRSYLHLKKILSHILPYWTDVTTIDAYDVGSLAGRVRSYAVAATFPLDDFAWPNCKVPEHRRQTVKQIIGEDWEKGNWRKIQGTVMEGLLKKNGNNNFRAENNRTLVGLDDKKIAAIVASYSRIQVTSSYLRHPEDSEVWRPFRSDEIAKILAVPDWYVFPEHQAETTKVSLLGQGVACDVARSIGIEGAFCFMNHEIQNRLGQTKNRLIDYEEPFKLPELKMEKNGQLCIF